MDFYDLYNKMSTFFKSEHPINIYSPENINTVNKICEICKLAYLYSNGAAFEINGYKFKLSLIPERLTNLYPYLPAFKEILENKQKFKLLSFFESHIIVKGILFDIIAKLTEEEINFIFTIINSTKNIRVLPEDYIIKAKFNYKDSEISICINLYNVQDSLEFYKMIEKPLNNIIFLNKLEE